MIAILLLTVGLFALAAAQRQHRELLPPFAVHIAPGAVRTIGWLCLAGSLAIQLAASPRSIAFLTWIGLVALIAGLIVLGRTFAPRWTAVALLALGAICVAALGPL